MGSALVSGPWDTVKSEQPGAAHSSKESLRIWRTSETVKSLEGSLKVLMTALLTSLGGRPEAAAAAEVLGPELGDLYRQFHPDTYGGAMLLGVRGVCIISHGSTNSLAMQNAIGVAAEMVRADVVGHLASAVGRAAGEGA